MEVSGSHWKPTTACVCMSRSHREPSEATGSRLKRGSNLLKHSPWSALLYQMPDDTTQPKSDAVIAKRTQVDGSDEVSRDARLTVMDECVM